MTSWQAIVLGFVQGITEFLPISSSAHLLFLERWMELPTGPAGMAFDLWLHIATLLALFTVYGKAVWAWGGRWYTRIRTSSRGTEQVFTGSARMLFWLAIATIPAVVFGVVGKEWIEVARTPVVAGSTLIVFGLLLWGVDVAVARLGTRPLDRLGWWRAGLIGVAQACALIPGVSRSGVVLTATRAFGLSRTEAVQWAFLLSVPVTAGAAAHVLIPMVRNGSFLLTAPMVLGAVVAWGTGIGAILVLRGVAEKASFAWFTLYRVLLGGLVLLFLL